MKVEEIPKDLIEGFQCHNATYCRSNRGNDDLLAVKEYVVLKDKTRIPHMRMIKNYKREFWVKREGYRKHKDKTEWAYENELQRFVCTQANLTRSVAQALGRPGSNLPLKQLASSPYLFGTDITTPPLLKKQYLDKWPDCNHPTSTVAVCDIETDVVNGTEDIIIITLSYKERVFTAINREFVKYIGDVDNRIQEAFDTYLGDVKAQRGITLNAVVLDTPGKCVEAVIKKMHEWMPDFVTFWNINFDMPKMIGTLQKEDFPLADVFSDPSIPMEFRFFEYVEGKSQKVTQSGKTMSLAPSDRWHLVKCPASWYMLDSMCLYRKLRIADGQEPSYSLDAIMNKHLSRGKLKFDGVKDNVSKLEWHRQMQMNFKIEYIIYNIFDCIGVEMLDEKIGDVNTTFTALCELAEFSDFISNPRRIAVDMHFFAREDKRVVAACSHDMTDELDKHVVSMTDWILTLPAHMAEQTTNQLVRDYPDLVVSAMCHNADLDLEGTYPKIEQLMNISKETTYREVGYIRGINEEQQREIGINLTGGVVNAIEICQTVYKLPAPTDWLEPFQKHLEKQKEAA